MKKKDNVETDMYEEALLRGCRFDFERQLDGVVTSDLGTILLTHLIALSQKFTPGNLLVQGLDAMLRFWCRRSG